MLQTHRLLLLLAFWVVGMTGPAAAQWSVDVPATPSPPRIDGQLEPGEWQGAGLIDDFRQVEPVEGAEPSERTEVHLLCDAENLYLGIQCHDAEPDKIVATLKNYDADLDPDDRVELVFDTFLDRRNAYFIQIGAAGSKGDGLIGNNGAFFVKDWDGIWEGRALVHSGGWSAEMAIPAKTLSMGADHSAFGFNITRVIKRRNEHIRWASPNQNQRLFTIATAGTLTGLEVLQQGLGLDIKPFLSLRGSRHHDRNWDHLDFEPGFDLRYRLTPALTAALTVNTDFAETEVDDRIVNLDRFPVFFPEKRDFFLEDAAIFGFGDLGSFHGAGGDPIPFFSRRIGLSVEGETIPILAGVKLTGRVEDFNLGLLDVITDSTKDIGSRNLGVARISKNILRESSVGALVTYGDPRDEGNNVLAGLDFTYRTTHFIDDDIFRLDAFLLGTRDDPDEEQSRTGYAYGVKASYPNDSLAAALGYREVSEDFAPDLGFAPRRGVRRLTGEIEYRPRIGGTIRRFKFGIEPDAFISLRDDRVETLEVRVQLLGVELESQDEATLYFTPAIERLAEPFEISPGIVLPEGRYHFERLGFRAETSNARLLSIEFGFETGRFFSGNRDSWDLELELRPGSSFSAELAFERNDIRLPEGDFDTNLIQVRLGYDFSPELSFRTFVQYDDVSESLGLNTRLHWIPQPGNDLYLVLNQGFSTRDQQRDRFSLSPLATDLTLKAAVTFRF